MLNIGILQVEIAVFIPLLEFDYSYSCQERFWLMDIPTTTHPWNQIIESLKSQGRQLRIEPATLKEDFKASNLMSPKLHTAIRRGDDVPCFVSELKKLCRSVHVSDIVEQVTRGGNTILHLAAKNQRPDILQLMVNHFPQLIIRRNIAGNTALHFAARTEGDELTLIILHHYAAQFHFDEVKKLLRIKNEFGNTALHEAVITSNDEVVRHLFIADEEVANYLNKEGKSPLYLAVQTGHDDAIDLMLPAALLQNRERHHGTSPLHAAITFMSSGGKIKHVHKSLLEGWETDNRHASYGSDLAITPDSSATKTFGKFPELIFLRDQKGRTALHFAAYMGNLEGVRTILRECPQSALEWDLKGYLPIHIACKKGHANVVNEFLWNPEPWFDPMELLNQKGQNLLHIAAKNGKDTVVEYVFNEKTLKELLNERDKNGNTPLHLASKYLHPNVLHLLTQKKGLDVNLVNNKGMTARDIVLFKRSTPPSLREFLSFAVIKSIGTPLSEKGRRIRYSHAEPAQITWIKDRVSTILVVAILVATVTFAAGFTVPGGVYNSDDKDTEKRGMATLLNKNMFQLFTICDAIAMYSSTMGSSILLWAHLGDFHIASSATYFAFYLVGLALITMSVAFMAAIHLAVRNVPGLADTVIAIEVIFLLMFLVIFFLLIFPLGERALFLGHISDFIFKMMIRFSGSHGKLKKVKIKEMKALNETNKEEDKGEPRQIRTEKLVRQRTF